MILENKLGIKSEIDLARVEEKLSKTKAKKIYESGLLDTLKAGSFESLAIIHKELFIDIYDFAGSIRDVNISKDSFRFASMLYLKEAIAKIGLMAQSTYDEILQKSLEKKNDF